MPSKSWGVIYCPKEGSSKTHKRWKNICRYLTSKGVPFDYVQSEGPGSVERLASMMTRAGYRTIIIVGGDAALNHALCGIMNTDSPYGRYPALGVIPNGFGNDFAKYWGFDSENYKSTIDSLIYRKIRRVDVGTVRAHFESGNDECFYFLNCVNLGVASSITNLKRKTNSLLGIKTLSYLFSSLLLLFQRINFNFSFELNGENIKQHAMALCIGSAHGYGQTPSAVPYNGLLDVTMVSKPQIVQIFHGIWLLYTGRFLSHRGVNVWRSNRIHISSLGHSLLSIDGRVIHKKISDIEIGIKQEEIEFLIP